MLARVDRRSYTVTRNHSVFESPVYNNSSYSVTIITFISYSMELVYQTQFYVDIKCSGITL